MPGAADLGVGEAEPDAEAERIGEEAEQEDRRRQHEQEPEAVPALGDPCESERRVLSARASAMAVVAFQRSGAGGIAAGRAGFTQ